MSEFNRDFSFEDNHPELVKALFERWALPGEACCAEKPLRLAIRNGYCNFYAKGQSVAKVSHVRDGYRVEVHNEYAHGVPKSERKKGEAKTGYQSIRGEELHDDACLDKWIEIAQSYASAEKCFVDDLCAANPNIIDLEMALPARIRGGSAPRMDIVALQGNKIVFWEAKCSDNPELRAKDWGYAVDGDGKQLTGIEVVHQLLKYQNWLKPDICKGTVEDAYGRAIEHMLALARAYSKVGAAVEIWEGAAQQAKLDIITAPGIIVGAYCAQGDGTKTETANRDRLYEKEADSFGKHEAHLKKCHGITVRCIKRGDNRKLPDLPKKTIIGAKANHS